MKTYIALLLLTTLGLKAQIEFTGFFTTSKEALFSLADTEANRSSGWLKIGQSFGSYTIESFDREQDIITLKQTEPKWLTRRQSQRLWLSRLVLRAARVAPATGVAHLER